MALTFNQTLTYHLGYPLGESVDVPDFSPEHKEALSMIMERLSSVDAELETNRKDSMAVDVAGVRLDFTRNIQITKQEGSRLLKALAQLSGVPLRYDRYLGRKPEEPAIPPLAVQNYA